jgi:hypothetical protein
MKHALPKRLTSKPSALILAALADLEQVENDPRYEVEMGTWHDPNGKCAVCLAGSVMAFGLGASPNQRHGPGEFDSATAGWPVPPYDDRAGFFNALADLAGILAAEGL